MQAFSKVYWSDVRDRVYLQNSQLAHEIDQLNPGKRLPLYLFSYPFAQDIITKGIFQVPYQNQYLALTDPKLPNSIREDLSYNFGSNPSMLVLNGTTELFIELEDRVIPYALSEQGRLMGLWKILDDDISHCPPTFCWGMTSGARSLFLLPKLTNEKSHARLEKHFNIILEKPQEYRHQWTIFRKLAEQDAALASWNSEILCFSKAWVAHLRDPSWKGLYNYFLEQAWKSSEFWRNQYIWALTFTRIQTIHKIKPKPFIDHLVRHILTVGVGALPGFAPAIDDSLAPIARLQEIYMDIYQLQTHQPLIMQPTYCSLISKKSQPIYLSMQHPTALEMTPRLSTRLSAIEDLHEINDLLSIYLQALQENQLNINTSLLHLSAQKNQYDFFHALAESDHLIQASAKIPKEDSAFLAKNSAYFGRSFPADSLFFKGCIRIKERRTK